MRGAVLRGGLAFVGLVGGAFLAGACGEEGEPPTHYTETPTSPPSTPEVTATPETQWPTEFKVAFINLLSPLTLDVNNTEAGETYEERLDAVIAKLKEFDPDIIGFNEASVTAEHGSAVEKLVQELKMEPYYVRANPQFPNTTQEEEDELVKRAGFEEGELILVKGSRYPVTSGETYVLNPRSSEAGEVRAALHVVVKGPPNVGEIDVYITHFTGGGDAVRRAQGTDFITWIAKTRGEGPTIVMSGQSDPAAASFYDLYEAIGLSEVAGADPVVTCCRTSVIGAQPSVSARSDYLMSARWDPIGYSIFGEIPVNRIDGSLLYMSDHNGIMATFPVPLEGAEAPDLR